MKKKLLVLLLLAGTVLVPAVSNAQRLSIEIGDRPYYTRGPSYWNHGRRYVWIPGHRAHHGRVWVHGHYEVRGAGWRDDRAGWRVDRRGW